METILMYSFLVVWAVGGISILVAPHFKDHPANKPEGEDHEGS